MMHRLTITVVIAALTVGAIACGGRGEPEGPTPEQLEQMRQDSIRAAEQARQDSLREAEEGRQRAEAERQRAMQMETEAARAVIRERIHFEYDRSALTEEAEETLMRKLTVLRANPDVEIRIEGHADERGSVEYNRALGQRRAEAAKDFLVGFGISPDRITTVSFGEDRPLVDERNPTAWAQNRRDEFSIVAGDDTLRNPVGR